MVVFVRGEFVAFECGVDTIIERLEVNVIYVECAESGRPAVHVVFDFSVDCVPPCSICSNDMFTMLINVCVGKLDSTDDLCA